jgi:hypothetical protein
MQALKTILLLALGLVLGIAAGSTTHNHLRYPSQV